MKLGIMQPYFFPYIGYFSLIDYTDQWVALDVVQYIERGWVNRNRIIHPNKPEAMYITVPLEKHSQNSLIKDIQINSKEDFKQKILSQLTASYKKRAPYFKPVMDLVSEVFQYNKPDLTGLNVRSLQMTCEYLGINLDYEIFSQMDIDIAPVADAGEWALNISKALHAQEYVNPVGGKELFSSDKFKNNNISLRFLQNNLQSYNQKKPSFIEGLSIIDVMMFNSIEEINGMLKDYKID